MSNYSAHDFAQWFESIHGYQPYPWQSRLVGEILAHQDGDPLNAGWPDVLDLPTGSGKTTAIDIAIYTQAANPIRAPRRIVYVVDRRAIVSQTADHVRKLQVSLLHPKGEVQERIAQDLRSRMAHASSERTPLLVAELRGGIALDDEWASEPDIPAVLISTVDQVGSRLLFRGYGVSPRMRPVHAGLLGNDCLWLLDEVHLSKPFALTLNQLKAMGDQRIKGGLPIRNGVVQMSATPVDKSAERFFRLDPVTDIEESPRLRERVQAEKQAQLKILKLQGAKRPEDVHIARIPQEAKRIKGNVIGVIVNRVETAVKVARGIQALDQDAVVVTLTGRMRPLERETVWKEVDRYARAGRNRSNDTRRVYIVSTQTIEAGADLDFDAMVTEVASMDALVQRAGRVDRRGELSAAGTPAQILIVAASSQTGSKYEDPVYGNALRDTWELLNGLHGTNTFDMGPASTELGTPDERLMCSTPQVRTTQLAEHHLDALCQTCPEPTTQPDVAYHLHGVQSSRAEVSVIWRGELPLTWASPALGEGFVGDNDFAILVEQLLLCPPRTTEAIDLPLPAFMRWAQNQTHSARAHSVTPSMVPVGVADVDRYVPMEDEGSFLGTEAFVLRWAGAESTLIPVSEVRNGDTLIVPLAWGGISSGNWDAEAIERVRDLGDLAQFKRALDYQGELPCIRLSPWFGWPAIGGMAAASDADRGALGKADRLRMLSSLSEGLTNLSNHPGSLPSDQVDLLAAFTPKRLVVCERVGDDAYPSKNDRRLEDGFKEPSRVYLTVVGQPIAARSGSVKQLVFETDGSDEASSLIGDALSLETHSDDVAATAAAYARSLGIDSCAEALRLAGSFHDLGKADPRFQTILHGGDVVRAAAAEHLLAKSAESPRNGAQALAIIEQSGYPRGTRHELMSLALLESLTDEAPADFDLIKYLVTTHHGMCRALPPRQDRSQSIEVTVEREGYTMTAQTVHGLDEVSSGITKRFWAMTEQFGWYGLAWLEATLRLADHHESARRAVQADSKKERKP